MDQLLLEIARTCNGGDLRVTGLELYEAMWFAPGFDGNPLTPASNPKDIVQQIQAGAPHRRLSTRLGGLRFLLDIEEKTGMPPDPGWYDRHSTDQPVVIVAHPDQVACRYMAVETDGFYSNEFVAQSNEPVSRYVVLEMDCHRLLGGQYQHTWDVKDP